MLPLLAGLLSGLASNGLSILANAITAKGTEVIEDKLGVKLPKDVSGLTPELVAQLKTKEIEHEEFLVDAAIRRAEVNLESQKVDMDNTKSARDMNSRIQESDHAAYLAKVAAYYLDFIIVSATLLLSACLLFAAIPEKNINLAYTVFGSLVTMCMTILNFHRGTSQSSKTKDDTINFAMKGTTP